MWVLRLKLIYLIFIILVPRNGDGHNGTNVEKGNEKAETYFARMPIDYLREFQSNKQAEKDRSSRKREALLPGILKGSLETGLFLPTGINAQLGPGLSLRLDPDIIPNIKQQIGGASVPPKSPNYPVKLYALNSKDTGKMLTDLNRNIGNITDVLKADDNSVVINPFNRIIDTNTVEKSQHSIKNLQSDLKLMAPTSQINNINTSYFLKPNLKVEDINSKVIDCNNTKMLLSNEENNTDVSAKYKNDFLVNNDTEGTNETHEELLLHKDITSEEDHMIPLIAILKPIQESEDFKGNRKVESEFNSNENEENVQNRLTAQLNEEPQPSPLETNGAETTIYTNYGAIPVYEDTRYIILDKLKSMYDQYKSTRKYEETEKGLNTYVINSDGSKINLIYNTSRKAMIPDNMSDYEHIPEYQNLNIIGRVLENNKYVNGDNINYNNIDGVLQDYSITRPLSKLSFAENNAYTNQNHETERIQKNYMAYRNSIDLKNAYYEHINNVIQEDTNINPTLKYYIEKPHTIEFQHREPENHEAYSYQKHLIGTDNENGYKIYPGFKNINPAFKYLIKDESIDNYPYQKFNSIPENNEVTNSETEYNYIHNENRNNELQDRINMSPVDEHYNEGPNKIASHFWDPKIDNYRSSNSQGYFINGFNGNQIQVIQDKKNVRPVYKNPTGYQNIDMSHHEKSKNIPEYSNRHNNENVFVGFNNEDGNNYKPDYKNVHVFINYPFEDQNIHASDYQEPKSVSENGESYIIKNDLSRNYGDRNNIIQKGLHINPKCGYIIQNQHPNAYQKPIFRLDIYNKGKNNVLHENTNIWPVIRYPFIDHNTNILHDIRPAEPLAENRKINGDRKDIIEEIRKRNNDALMCPRTLNLYYGSIKPCCIKLDLNYENIANPKRIHRL